MILPGCICTKGNKTIQETYETNYTGWNQHEGIKAKPGKVKTNLDSKIISHSIYKINKNFENRII